MRIYEVITTDSIISVIIELSCIIYANNTCQYLFALNGVKQGISKNWTSSPFRFPLKFISSLCALDLTAASRWLIWTFLYRTRKLEYFQSLLDGSWQMYVPFPIYYLNTERAYKCSIKKIPSTHALVTQYVRDRHATKHGCNFAGRRPRTRIDQWRTKGFYVMSCTTRFNIQLFNEILRKYWVILSALRLRNARCHLQGTWSEKVV